MCTSKDIKGLLVANMCHEFLSERGHRLSVVLADDCPISDGKRLAKSRVGNHEGDMWFAEGGGFLSSLPLVEQRDRPDQKAFRSFQELEAGGVNVLTLHRNKSINKKCNLDLIRAIEPDIIFSARFQHIFKQEVLAIPRHGVINMHPGQLPKYKGLYTDLQSMINRERESTMTLHHVDTGVDTGLIINTAHVQLGRENQSFFGVRLALDEAGCCMFFEHLARIDAGKSEAPCSSVCEANPEADASIDTGNLPQFGWPSEEDYTKFERIGLELYNKEDIRYVQAKFGYEPLEVEVPLTITVPSRQAPLQMFPDIGRLMLASSPAPTKRAQGTHPLHGFCRTVSNRPLSRLRGAPALGAPSSITSSRVGRLAVASSFFTASFTSRIGTKTC